MGTPSASAIASTVESVGSCWPASSLCTETRCKPMRRASSVTEGFRDLVRALTFSRKFSIALTLSISPSVAETLHRIKMPVPAWLFSGAVTVSTVQCSNQLSYVPKSATRMLDSIYDSIR